MNRSTIKELARLSGIIELIYEGTIRVEAWPRILKAIADHFGATKALLFTPFRRPENGGFEVLYNLDAKLYALWGSKYHLNEDIWTIRAFERNRVVTGGVFRDQDVVTDEEFLPSVMNREVLAPSNIGRLMSGTIFSGESADYLPTLLSCYRPFSSPFTNEDAAVFGMLLPHISRAMGVMFRLRDAEFKVAVGLAALDRLERGVLLLGAMGQVMYLNPVAGEILRQNDGLRLSNHVGDAKALYLHANRRSDQDALNAAISEALSPNVPGAKHFSRAINVQRTSGKTPYKLHYSSLPKPNEFGVGGDAPRAIAFLSDSTAPARLEVALLQSTFGMTAAEIRISELIVDGNGNEEIARALRLSVNTVKTHLRHVYEKTNTDSRARLVKLLLSFSGNG